ncbi:hypothetical protein B0O80DRAFT_498942 [Mortierella sp. GBAus27b]|nr:hypothetical protein B0O80DRAFT_498942 [Mortierella sp. GBAus27b]
MRSRLSRPIFLIIAENPQTLRVAKNVITLGGTVRPTLVSGKAFKRDKAQQPQGARTTVYRPCLGSVFRLELKQQDKRAKKTGNRPRTHAMTGTSFVMDSRLRMRGKSSTQTQVKPQTGAGRRKKTTCQVMEQLLPTHR